MSRSPGEIRQEARALSIPRALLVLKMPPLGLPTFAGERQTVRGPYAVVLNNSGMGAQEKDNPSQRPISQSQAYSLSPNKLKEWAVLTPYSLLSNSMGSNNAEIKLLLTWLHDKCLIQNLSTKLLSKFFLYHKWTTAYIERKHNQLYF